LHLAQKWVKKLEKRSLLVKKYGSFLPEQRELLSKVYERFQVSKKRIWSFSSPPASGKTHVIALLAQFLSEENAVAVVVPNNYLRQQFHEQESLISGNLDCLDILNLAQYLRTKKTYDYVLIDEAHNLKSSLELNPYIIKAFELSLEDELCQDLHSRLLPADKNFVAKQLSFTSCKEALDSLCSSKYGKLANKISEDPTTWECFAYIRREGTSRLLFVKSPLSSLKTPSKVMMLFSATPLSAGELFFYCGLGKEVIEENCAIRGVSKKRRTFFSIPSSPSFDLKIDLLSNILKRTPCRTLVLFNNSVGCEKAYNRILIPDRVLFCIKTRMKAREDIHQEFIKSESGVLFTSSQVFWEGITIKDLKLVVFFDLPYPRPHLIDLKKGRRVYGKRDLVRRLNQGMGRIGRKNSGIGVLLFGVEGILAKLNYKVSEMEPSSLPLFVHKTIS
jgi:hypothetical protein